MKDGFIKTAAATPKVRVADPEYNGKQICALMDQTTAAGAKVVVFPELCITGYTCGDLFLQDILLREALDQLAIIAEHSAPLDGIFFVGLPFAIRGNLYNVAAAVSRGKVMALVPKTFVPNYNEFYEKRYFHSAPDHMEMVTLPDGSEVPFGTELIFTCHSVPELAIGAEICEDLWAPAPPSIDLALAGATMIVNLSASDETTGKDRYRRDLVTGQSGRLICGYVYASAGDGESTQDVVYSGHNLIAENGSLLAESKRFTNQTIYSEIDVVRLSEERRRDSSFSTDTGSYAHIGFDLKVEETVLTRIIDDAPFVPHNAVEREKRCDEILMIQAMGLKKRLEHTHSSHVVVGISGGLDSTLALLVCARAFDLLGLDRSGIIAVTMPGFGTTDRTYDNAVTLVRRIHASLREISISNAVLGHFKDIGHDPDVHDVTYENCQARERTQILMDLSNQENALVIGTGDLSELALGWATYNGDHMSMYAVNVSVPKTLVRHLVKYFADTCGDASLSDVLTDVLNTPVSPELLPPEDGKISQKTEQLVGPYELHDFFLYHMLRFGSSPKKVYRLACLAFEGTYSSKTIWKWLNTFYRRFFSQHFKRSCLPDGPKVGTVAVSPRGDLRMPSDACSDLWLSEMERIRP